MMPLHARQVVHAGRLAPRASHAPALRKAREMQPFPAQAHSVEPLRHGHLLLHMRISITNRIKMQKLRPI